MSKLNSNIYATCFFCDDIRHENNGKEIIIGKYNSDMMIPSIPHVFKTLNIQTSLYYPIEKPEEVTSIEILRDNEEIVKINIELPSPKEHINTEGAVLGKATLNLELKDFTIDSTGRIKVWVNTKSNKKIYAGSILIKHKEVIPSQDSINFIATLMSLYNSERFDKKALGVQILKTMNKLLDEPTAKYNDKDLVFVPLPKNEVQVYYTKLYSKSPTVVINSKKESSKLNIIHKNKFGFLFKDERKERTEVNILIEDSNDK